MPVLQVLSDDDYRAKVAHPTLASLVQMWEDHIGAVNGKRSAKPPAFDLTPSQKHHFARLTTALKLGIPIDRLTKPRRVEVAIA